MLATEEEAKEKWCQETYNHADDIETCLAFQCMAWRWAKPNQVCPKCGSEREPTKFKCCGQEPTIVHRGYCGKAGSV